jgi:hypothetical protein
MKNVHLKSFYIIISLIIFSGCSSMQGSIRFFARPNNQLLIHIPPTEWETNNKIFDSIIPDITYLSDTDETVTCNISIIGKKSTPRNVTNIKFIIDTTEIVLNDISVLYTNTPQSELRLTAKFNKEQLFLMAKSNTIKLQFDSQGISYYAEANKKFYKNMIEFDDYAANL